LAGRVRPDSGPRPAVASRASRRVPRAAPGRESLRVEQQQLHIGIARHLDRQFRDGDVTLVPMEWQWRTPIPLPQEPERTADIPPLWEIMPRTIRWIVSMNIVEKLAMAPLLKFAKPGVRSDQAQPCRAPAPPFAFPVRASLIRLAKTGRDNDGYSRPMLTQDSTASTACSPGTQMTARSATPGSASKLGRSSHLRQFRVGLIG